MGRQHDRDREHGKDPPQTETSEAQTERPITRSAEARIRKLIENPPRGSAIAKAKKFGVDLYSILENLKLTPAERFRRGDANRMFVQKLREAGRKAGL
jgi:hypothetical protein